MSTVPVPLRPRVAAHVLPRRHVIDGEEKVLLHDQQRDEVLQIGPREWGVLEAADGTRDVEGIVVAARRSGAYARVAAVRRLLERLAERGMLDAGEAAEPPSGDVKDVDESGDERVDVESPERATDSKSAGVVEASSDSDVESRAEPTQPVQAPEPSSGGAKPLIPVPGGDLRCNGAGTCCRLYGTVMLSPVELRRVQTVLPDWRVGPVPPERWGMPVRGSEPGPILASVARDGACGFLQDDGLCAVHRAGGAEAKPFGCRAFPRIYVDDGVAVHVSVKPECPCVLEPKEGDAEPVIDPAYTDAESLPSLVVVDVLPDSLELHRGRWIDRASVRRWFSQIAQRPAPRDPAATAWALADRIGAEGLPEPDDEAWSAGPPPVDVVRPWISALHRRALARAREHAAWRSSSDLVRRMSTSLALLTRLLQDPDVLAEALAEPPEHPEHEARFWQTGVHAYRWPRNGAIDLALRDDAVRVWVARSLPLTLEDDGGDPDLRAPLALVEAMLRAHGVAAYVDDLAQKL